MSAPPLPVLRSPDALSVSPAALVASSHPLIELAGALRSAAPGLTSAWEGAARVLAAQHTGQALTAGQSRAAGRLTGCAGSMEELGDALARAADTYLGAERRAVIPLQNGH